MLGKEGKHHIFLTMEPSSFGCHLVKYLHDLYKENIEVLCVGLYKEDEKFKQKLQEYGAKVIQLEKDCQEQLSHIINDKYEVVVIPNEGTDMECVRSVLKACKERNVHCVGLTSWNGARYSNGKMLGAFNSLEEYFEQCNIKKRCLISLDLFQEELKLQAPAIQDKGMVVFSIGDESFSPVCSKDAATALANLIITHYDIGKEEKGVKRIVFSGPKCVNGEKIANIASETLGMEIKFHSVNREENKKYLMMNKGVSEECVELILDYYDVVAKGYAHGSPGDLRKALGKEPATLETFFKENKDHFKPPSS